VPSAAIKALTLIDKNTTLNHRLKNRSDVKLWDNSVINFDINLQRYPQAIPNLARIKDDPAFDPSIHLALEQPDNILTLSELGYALEIDGTTPTPIAATSCFRILSDEWVATLQHVCKQREAFTSSNPRIENCVWAGVYRSSFLRDFSLSPDVAEHLSILMQTPLFPHTMGHQLSHINYPPSVIGNNVDKWLYDTLGVDYVMFVIDPNKVQGGEFEYFLGTRDEFADLSKSGEPVPLKRTVAPDLPGAGYAILMQGNYVVHRAKALLEKGDRITLVNGYTYGDLSAPDYTALGQIVHAAP
jgi:hypothetical protein